MAKRTNYFQLALDLRRGPWLIHGAEHLVPVVNAFLNKQRIDIVQLDDLRMTEYSLSGPLSDSEKKGEEKQPRVIIVPLKGTMTKYETCESYGTEDIAGRMTTLVNDPTVVGFVLDVDSGGGAANSVPPMVAAIEAARAAGKPVLAHVDFCASAAYWVASQCDAIFMDNPTSSAVGSIGAFAQILDDREDKSTGFKIITVYAPQSSDKNKAYREALDGKVESMQAELAKLVTRFQNSVKAGRTRLKADAEGVLSGAMFELDDALAVGLADGRASLQQCVENVFIRAEFK